MTKVIPSLLRSSFLSRLSILLSTANLILSHNNIEGTLPSTFANLSQIGTSLLCRTRISSIRSSRLCLDVSELPFTRTVTPLPFESLLTFGICFLVMSFVSLLLQNISMWLPIPSEDSFQICPRGQKRVRISLSIARYSRLPKVMMVYSGSGRAVQWNLSYSLPHVSRTHWPFACLATKLRPL